MDELADQNRNQICRWHDFENMTALDQAAVEAILGSANKAIHERGAFHIVLAGGTTPRRVYEKLRDAKTDWNAWHIYYGDERFLPSHHPDRNSSMASAAWLDHVAIPSHQIHSVQIDQGIISAAKAYARIVNNVQTFDLVLLGLGEDGHTASIFPLHEFGDSPDSPATLVIMDAAKPPPQRISLSARRLSQSLQVSFLVTGSSKAQAVQDWRSGALIPASAIKPKNGVDIFVERALLVFK